MSADYKSKYLNIRAKLAEASDVAFRLGYEQGMKDAMMQQAQQQVQQMQQEQAMQEQAMMQAQQGQPGMSAEEQAAMEADSPESGAPMEEEMPTAEEQGGNMGSELDQHIEELQGLVAKGEKPSVLSMRKAVEELASLRKSQKEKMSRKMSENASSQKKFVDNILKKWEEESKEISGDLEDILKQHDIQVEE